ncbi:protein of unknown function [Parapedobacter luteus]|uniref:DUF4292 domain-containing protein n=1 Tax=Parapedobacter luteus TaxID=623280 RepID=A0A1T5BMU2_9SPHI|nr:DUF4292 domain-containing protein [Parapedobacter luteus]SKB48437.1 protein of unknown function [Parapedobacter luteus]
MRNNILIKGAVVLVLFITVLSCAPKKRLVTDGEGNERRLSDTERLDVMNSIIQNEPQFTTFSGRAKSRIVINKDNYDVTANVRMERGKAIWISVTALMGIEAGRMLITPDSVQIINRLKAEYLKKPFSYIHHFTNKALDFTNLQQLLAGHIIGQAVEGDTKVWAVDGGHILRGQTNELVYTIHVDAAYRMMSTLLDEAVHNQRLEVRYSAYQESGRMTSPYQLTISAVADGFNLQAEMSYSRVTYDEALAMPFSIPARYKEIH